LDAEADNPDARAVNYMSLVAEAAIRFFSATN
jgi:hypothetical protein